LTGRPPHNIDAYRARARRKLPLAVFDFLDGGSEDEATLRGNREAFESIRLLNRIHATQEPLDLSTELCGQRLALPIVLSPVGNSGMLHPDGDRAAAIAAAERGALMLMSGGASYSIEEVAEAADPKPWYQLYPWLGQSFYGPLIDRAAASGFRGLVVTVDTPCSANRERDVVNKFVAPPRLTRKSAFEIARHPRWVAGVLRERRVVVKLFAGDPQPTLLNFVGQATRAGAKMGRTLSRPTWDDLAWIRSRWDGPLGIKGITDPEDAVRAADLGANAVFVSNHGGRQLDGAPGALEALPPIVAAVGGRVDVVLDGGVRRGTDIIKALCLGATAVGIGRAWAYGLASDGLPGVRGALNVLRRELEISLELLGQPRLAALDPSFLVPAGVPGYSAADRERTHI
jgi:isopentenyl diphosphate isomerase/L-lactate dehydrogenase-like FMN-dependent dehydrogenase